MRTDRGGFQQGKAEYDFVVWSAQYQILNGIVACTQESYLALDKGPISDEHVLIIPVDHYASSMALTPLCYSEVER